MNDGNSIRLNIFAHAKAKQPSVQDDLPWGEVAAELAALVNEEHESKLTMPAFTLGELRDNERSKHGEGSQEAPFNLNANYANHTALAIDVDRLPSLENLAELIELNGLAALVYASSSDPNPDGSRRVRIVTPLSRPLLPSEVKHARLAFAEALAIGPGQGVEGALAVSQIMFVGRVAGTPERETVVLEGSPIDADDLMAKPLRETWRKRTEPREVAPLDRVACADPDDRTLLLLAELEAYWSDETDGKRGILRALGGYLARRGWSDEQIAAVAVGLAPDRPVTNRVALAVECARDARANPASAAGWNALCSWDANAAAVIESVAKDSREPDGWNACAWSEWWGAYLERRATRKPAAIVDALDPKTFAPADPEASANEIPLFLCSRNGAVTLMWEGDELGHRPIHEKRIRLRCGELGFDRSTVALRDDKGKPVSVDKLLEEHGESYTHTAYAFANRVTEYDPEGEGSVVIGYPRRFAVGRFDPEADAWLRALGGPHYERLAVWIASCSQENINRLSACLVIIGTKNTGKSLLGTALAHMWGEDPPPLELLVVQFNADLARCPILVDEEAQLFGSRKLSTKRFRDVIQARHRGIELKGKERCQLRGGLRAYVPCNAYSDLRFEDLGGPAVVAALRDRMLVINATGRTSECAAALAPMQDPIEALVDLDRIASHLVWLCETTELPAERFLGAGGDDSESAILAGHIDDTIDVWESLQSWLDGAGGGKVWSIHDKRLSVDPAQLAMSIEKTGRGWSLRDVRAALAPFHADTFRPRSEGSETRPRLWALDADRVGAAMALDADTAKELRARIAPAEPFRGLKRTKE